MKMKLRHDLISGKCAILLLVAVVAFLPRALDLDAFLTLDEYLWVDRSRNFLLALQAWDWSETFQTGHPGITTMWTGAAGMWAYGLRHGMVQEGTLIPFLESLSWSDPYTDLLITLRLPTVVLTTLVTCGIYLLLHRLWGSKVALVGGLLVALDPWYLAHSRVLHHDALMASFMTLSALALLAHIFRGPSRWTLPLSGACAGLALLSKTLALFLLPWTVLLFAVALWQRRWTWSQALVDLAIWGVSACLVVFVLWPAMWLDPTDVVRRMVEMVATYARNPNEVGQFFLGRPVPDPGPLFYPLVGAFALTPLVVLGLLTLAGEGISGLFRNAGKDLAPDRCAPVRLLSVYVGVYLVFIALGEKKQARYLLPAILMLNVIAAVGLPILLKRIRDTVGSRVPRSVLIGGLLMMVLIGQALVSLPHHPYYTTYYNPLLGGNQVAARLFLVGWGAGNDLAADYLNSLPQASHLTITGSAPPVLAPFFDGQTILWWPHDRVFAADYVVLYRRDVVRGLPDSQLVEYIQTAWPLEETIDIRGLPYAWIYRAPGAHWTASMGDANGLAHRPRFLAYRIESQPAGDGQELTVTLYRRGTSSAAERCILEIIDGGSRDEVTLLPVEEDVRAPAGGIVETVYRGRFPYSFPIEFVETRVGLQGEDGGSITWLTSHSGH